MSGIEVGQSRRRTSRSFGNSSAVMPRMPSFLASKCTWQNTPKKCMQAGTMAAMMMVW